MDNKIPEISNKKNLNKKKKKKKSKRKKCKICKKKLSLIAFPCRCDNYFCYEHKNIDLHKCPFDYRKSHKDLLTKQLVKCTFKKIAVI